MIGPNLAEAQRAFAQLPRGGYLLTSRFEQKRAGQIVSSSFAPSRITRTAIDGGVVGWTLTALMTNTPREGSDPWSS